MKGKNKMTQFSIKTNVARTVVQEEEKLQRELADIQQRIQAVSSSMGFKIASSVGIKRRIGNLSRRVENHGESMKKMRNALERTVDLYEKTEKSICINAGEGGRTVGMQTAESGKTGTFILDALKDLLFKTIGIFGTVTGNLFPQIGTIWQEMFEILENLVSSIGKGDVTDKQPKTEWASGILGGIAATVISGTQSDSTTDQVTTSSTATNSTISTAELNGKVGTVVADINGENYCSNKNISYSGGYAGQCTWYAYGRFMEVTGIALNSARHAKTWLGNNVNDSRVNITYGMENIQCPAIAVAETGGGGYGHVMFVEGVEYNADGTPAYVYLTEANNSYVKPDGVLQKLSYHDFLGKNISGYITAV